MIITSKTKLKEMSKIYPILNLADIDLLKECAKFPLPSKISGITPKAFYNVSFNDLAWLWDIKDPNEKLNAITEIFFYSELSLLKKWLYKDPEKWVKKWIKNVPLIDFYNFASDVENRTNQESKEFSDMKINLTDDEKKAGYGKPDKDSIAKMKDTFALRYGIHDIEKAGDYSWTRYKLAFKIDIDNANTKRRYNEIISTKK